MITIIRDSASYRACRPPCYVDEHLLAKRTLTWTDWSRGGAHPTTFEKFDITEMFLKMLLQSHSCFYSDQPYQVCYLFARKFDPSALEPLLKLATKVLDEYGQGEVIYFSPKDHQILLVKLFWCFHNPSKLGGY
ncbi:hypothetical protein Rs2_26813 [Raphanus sativus]|nr:hypothetical protein Rs2_26813 [Raphanus sativus]